MHLIVEKGEANTPKKMLYSNRTPLLLTVSFGSFLFTQNK